MFNVSMATPFLGFYGLTPVWMASPFLSFKFLVQRSMFKVVQRSKFNV